MTIYFMKKVFVTILICTALFHVKSAQSEEFNCDPLYDLLESSYKDPKYKVEEGLGFILYKDGTIICRKFFGPMSEKSIVKIASATKWISASVIMSLVDNGLISLDDTVGKYLDDLINKNDKEANLKRNITIRQLLSHTHGLSDTIPYNLLPFLTMKQAARLIMSAPLLFQPGKAFSYGGVGLQVAGYIVERITSTSWIDQLNERIIKPLKMEHTKFSPMLPYMPVTNPDTAGGLSSTLDDLGHFALMIEQNGLFDGINVLSKNAVKEMLKKQTDDVKVLKHPWNEYVKDAPDMYNIPYGLGCWLEKVDNVTGDGLYAESSGLFGTIPFVDLERHLAGILLAENINGIQIRKGLTAYEPAHVIYIHLRNLIKELIPTY